MKHKVRRKAHTRRTKKGRTKVKKHSVRVKKRKRHPVTGRLSSADVRLDELFLRRDPKVRIKRKRDLAANEETREFLSRLATAPDPLRVRRDPFNQQILKAKPTKGEKLLSELDSHQATVDALSDIPPENLSDSERRNLTHSSSFLQKWEERFKNQQTVLNAQDREMRR